MSGGSNSNDTTRRQDPPVTELELEINTAFATAIAKLLSVNDAYGDRVLRTAILDELNGLCRYIKRTIWRLQSQEMPPKG